jgi:hypothetical protein
VRASVEDRLELEAIYEARECLLRDGGSIGAWRYDPRHRVLVLQMLSAPR